MNKAYKSPDKHEKKFELLRKNTLKTGLFHLVSANYLGKNRLLAVTEYKKVVRQSWTILETVIDRLNSTFHKRLGEVDPLAESCFKDTVLVEQGAAPFLTIIATAVAKLDDLDSLVPILQSQGKLQRKLGAKTKQYDAIGASFLYALEQVLAQVWSKSVKEAWTWVFVFVAKVMQPPEDDETKKKNAIRRTWGMMEKIYLPFMDLLFKTLGESDPTLATAIQLVDLPAQKTLLIQSITAVLPLLDDKEKLTQKLSSLAQTSLPKSTEMKHYKTFGDAFLRTLMAALGAEFSADVRDAWTWVYSMVAKAFIAEMDEARKAAAAAALLVVTPVTESLPMLPPLPALPSLPALTRIATAALPANQPIVTQSMVTATRAGSTPPQSPVTSESESESTDDVPQATNIDVNGLAPEAEVEAEEETVIVDDAAAHIRLVRQSWAWVVPVASVAMAAFYKRLFEIDTSAHALFTNVDVEHNGSLLATMLSDAVSKLDSLDKLMPSLIASGKRHLSYGVVASQYDSVGAALLYTLSTKLGEKYTPAHKAAWVWVYELLAETMKGKLYDKPPVVAAMPSVKATAVSSQSVSVTPIIVTPMIVTSPALILVVTPPTQPVVKPFSVVVTAPEIAAVVVAAAPIKVAPVHVEPKPKAAVVCDIPPFQSVEVASVPLKPKATVVCDIPPFQSVEVASVPFKPKAAVVCDIPPFQSVEVASVPLKPKAAIAVDIRPFQSVEVASVPLKPADVVIAEIESIQTAAVSSPELLSVSVTTNSTSVHVSQPISQPVPVLSGTDSAALGPQATITLTAEALEKLIASAVTVAVHTIFQSAPFSQLLAAAQQTQAISAMQYYAPAPMMFPPRMPYGYPPYGGGFFQGQEFQPGQDFQPRSPSPFLQRQADPQQQADLERSVAAVAARLAAPMTPQSVSPQPQQLLLPQHLDFGYAPRGGYNGYGGSYGASQPPSPSAMQQYQPNRF